MKKRIFSGIQPSGNLHLGNYLGAIKNWVKLQNEYDSIFCIVDLHAITIPQNPQELSQKTLEVAKLYLASGIDPEKSIVFIQSQVQEHAELMWLLNTITKNGDLMKMTQFKDKSKVIVLKKKLRGELVDRKVFSRKESLEYLLKEYLGTKTGLFNYPILMAADILLYDTNLVPVGEDQLQHVELTRKLGRKFNQEFGETFTIPEGFTQKESKRIMGLDDPTNKMSKSASSDYNRIDLLDSPETIERKVMKAVTDSGQGIEYSDNKPALKNLINIFSLVANKKPEEIVTQYENQGYKKLKEELAQAVVDYLRPIQEKYNQISDEEVKKILSDGAKRARKIAETKIKEVKKKMGMIV